jgi:hypothetical protein
MTDDLLRYDLMIETALRDVVQETLQNVARNGLPGEHHFYITFLTHFPGVEIPDYLKKQYPEEMTIVLQYQFTGLKVDEDGFGVTLSFNNVKERLRIPFEAITTFADPSVNFALQFQSGLEDDGEEGDEDAAMEPPKSSNSDEKDEKDDKGDGGGKGKGGKSREKAKDGEKKPAGEVISLDMFRKK